jgi:hypothetical protein
MQGFAPPGIPGNLGLNLPAPSPTAPPGTVTADAPATATAQVPGAIGFVGPQSVNQGQVGFDEAAPPTNFPTLTDPESPFNMPFPTPLSPQTEVPMPTARPADIPSTVQSQIDAAKQALQNQQNLPAPFAPAPNMFGAPASGNIGAPAVGTGHAPVGPPSSFSAPAAPSGQLGSNISGFAPGSGLGNFAAAAAATGPVAAEAVSIGFPPTAAIAMQSLYNMPMRA